MQGIEDLTFSFETVVQLITLVVAIVLAWAYLKKNFEANDVRLSSVEEDLKANADDVTAAIERISIKIDGIHSDMQDQHVELVKITGTGDLLAQRIQSLENKGATA